MTTTTSVCRLLGCTYPILQAGTASAARAELVAAVGNAGGFGFLGGGGLGADGTRRRIAATRALTARPFGVNLLLPKLREGQIEVCLEQRPRCVSFFWGDPAPYVSALHDAGVLVTAQVGSVDEACRVVEAGVDFVIAQGFEAGGHVRGTVSTFALIPRVVDAIAPVPVVAAGGIADARGIVAALALGAQAAMLGTRFVATVEAVCHPEYKQRLVAARESDTVWTKLFDGGWPDAEHRVLRNRQVEEWEAAGAPAPGRRPGEGDTIGQCTDDQPHQPVARYSSWLPRADFDGDLDYAALYAGESCGLVNAIRPAGEVVAELARETQALLRELGNAATA